MKRALDAFKWLGIVGGIAVWGWLGFAVFNDPRPSKADTLTIPNSFSVGQVADPSTVNANFDAIKNLVNGKIDNDNWDPAGPDLTCANFDQSTGCITSTGILDSTITTADFAPTASTAEVFSTTNPTDVTGLSCATGWTDITGASWTVTASGSIITAVFNGSAKAQNSLSPADLEVRMVIDGTNGPTLPIVSPTVAGNDNLQDDFGLNGWKAVSSGSRTIKIQCRDGDTTSDGIDFKGMQVTIIEQ
jgi:hypothetical protein